MRWILILILLLGTAIVAAQPAGAPANLTTARVVVSIGNFYNEQTPELKAEDLTVTQGFDPVPVSRVIPLRNGIELYLLVDNCSDCEPGTKFEELSRFIRTQPQTTAVGIAYIRNGRLEIAEPPGADRERAIKALSPPSGGSPASPFGALRELIGSFKQDSLRHVILMVTNGMDPAPEASPNPAAEAAIETAQRAGVTVFAIYHPSADYLNTDFERIYAGQVQVAHVAAETGGEAYFITSGPLPSLAPFLGDIADHLANQYVLELSLKPAEGTGALREIDVKTTNRDLEVIAPAKVWVPAKGR